MTKADLHRLVEELPEDAVERTATLLKRVISLRQIDADQRWFWAPEWQEGEREAEDDLAAGRFTRFETDQAFLDHLDGIAPASDPSR